MFSVIIPTIWSSELINGLVNKLSTCSLVGEIILINNNSSFQHSLRSDKLREFIFLDNQYVNGSWNFGVSVSNYEKICIINDDIDIDIDSFYFMDRELDTLDGIVGISKSCYAGRSDYYLSKIHIRNKGWGCAIFLNKCNYYEIPKDLKIWFGDDWLIKMNTDKVYSLNGPMVITDMSQSVNLPDFKFIIEQDINNSIKYNLPWSSDY